MIDAGQIRIQYGLPIRFFHAHEQSVTGDAGIIDENIHGTKLCLDGFDHIGHGLFVCYVTLEHSGGCAQGFGLLLRFFGSCRITGIDDGHIGSFPGQQQGYGAADAAGTACYDRSFTC